VLNDFVGRELGRKANKIIGRTGKHVVSRAASFLLLAESRASFEIEGERRRVGAWNDGAARCSRPVRIR
jgi:hypothetical protein